MVNVLNIDEKLQNTLKNTQYTRSLALEKEFLSTTPSYEYTRSGFYYIIMFSTKTAKNNCITIMVINKEVLSYSLGK